MATRKKPAKKAVKKAPVKRTYNRKPKAAPVQEKTEVPPEKELPSLGETLRQASNIGDAEAPCMPSRRELLEEIEILDLTQLNSFQKILIFQMLKEAGYLSSTLKDLVEDDETREIGVGATALKLQHVNKLVYSGNISDEIDNEYTSRPTPYAGFTIGFTRPGPIIPDEIITNQGAHYVRVG